MKLTLPQQDVYFEQLLYTGEPIYNIGAKIAIKGNIQVALLQKAYVALIDQHDAYRSVVGDDMTITVKEHHDSELEFMDFSEKKNADESANTFMQSAFKKPFYFEDQTFLHRFVLIKVDESFHYLFSVYHHIITDGWGTSLMFQRLVSNYNELVETGQITSDYPYEYSTFVEDDKEYHDSEAFEKDRAYWKSRFEILPEQLFEKIDEKVHVNQSRRKELIIKRTVYNQLGVTAKACKASSFHVILAILYLYFARVQRNKDIAIGLPVLNRGKSVFKRTVGLFMGVSALRIEVDFEDTFDMLVQKIRQQLRQDYRHQRFPLGKLIQSLDLLQDKGRLFNMTLSYEKQNYADHFKDTETRVVPLSHQSERVALAIYIREFDEQEDVKIDFDYNINYFDEKSITKVVNHFDQLVHAVNAAPDKKLSEYSYLDESEKELILETFNQTQFDYPKDKTFLSYFQQHVFKSSDRLAIRDDEKSYTYQQLGELSNKVSNYLTQKLGADNQSPIAVLMNRSADMLVALLGVLKSGNAFIPLDPNFPSQRIKYIIEHSQVKCLLGTDDLKNVCNSDIDFIDVAKILTDSETDCRASKYEAHASDTAYIIYTSGSTGHPKGVAIGQQSLLNFLLSIQQKPQIQKSDLLFSVTTQSFDISILEFFAPLISGASIYMASPETLEAPMKMLEQLEEVKPTIIQATPSFYQMLFNAGWEGDPELKILCGGDLLSNDLADKLLQNCAELWNMYGPTETTIWSSIKKINSASEASNIGTPMHNTQMYILDDCLQALPVGKAGALYIGGDGLAQGYYHNEALTDEKFIPNPFDKTGKIYETGDLGKWNAQGEIEFLGRNDHQVKIRGYRIELGEIETHLNQMDEVQSAVVVAKKLQNQEAILVAFIIFNTENTDPDWILLNLRKELPDYMIPQTIIPVDVFPVTPNNKVDRKQLSAYDIKQKRAGSIYRKPVKPLEATLCKYVKEILEIDSNISISDNFFALGGQSLSAVKLINRIDQELQNQLTLKDIFNHPTVELLASFLELGSAKKAKPITKVEDQIYYPVTSSQYAIWLAAQQEDKSIAYNMSAAFEVSGKLEEAILQKAFLKVIQKYEILRTNFIEAGGAPRQMISYAPDEVVFEIDKISIENRSMEAAIQSYKNRVFDLEQDLLLRVGMLERNQNSMLVFCTHHIIMDGWSLEILIDEVRKNYIDISSDVNSTEAALPFQFRDYSVWLQKEILEREVGNDKYWEAYLQGYQWKKIIPEILGNNQAAKNNGATFFYHWDADFLNSLKAVAQRNNVTIHTLLVACFNVLLHKMYGLQDICVGTVNSGRNNPDLQDQIGMFVKTLPLRTEFLVSQSFATLVQKTHQDLMEIDSHQDMPGRLRDKLRLEFLLAYQSPTLDYKQVSFGGQLHLKLHATSSEYNRIPLLINFSENANQLATTVDYSLDSFDAESIELLLMRLEKLLRQIISNHTLTIDDLEIEWALKKEVAVKFNF